MRALLPLVCERRTSAHIYDGANKKGLLFSLDFSGTNKKGVEMRLKKANIFVSDTWGVSL